MRNFMLVLILMVLPFQAQGSLDSVEAGATDFSSECADCAWGKDSLTNENPAQVKEFVAGFMLENPKPGETGTRSKNPPSRGRTGSEQSTK